MNLHKMFTTCARPESEENDRAKILDILNINQYTHLKNCICKSEHYLLSLQ